MAYIGNQPVLQSTEFREEFFPSSNQTAFTTGGFHPSAVSVTRNGVLLSEADYTKGTDNVTITLNSAAVSGDVVVIRGNRSLAQGVSVSESRVEHTWQSGDTVVQLNADVIPAYTDVYLNGVKLAAADYSINASTKQVSFTSAPAVGDVIAVVHRNETSALVALPLKDSYGNEVLSQSGNAVSIGTLRLPTSGGIQDSSGANVLIESGGVATFSGTIGASAVNNLQDYVAVTLPSNQTLSHATTTVINLTSEADPNGWFDTSTFKFQPDVSGKYYISLTATGFATSGLGYLEGIKIGIKKNNNSANFTAAILTATQNGQTANGYIGSVVATGIIDMNGSSDYLYNVVYGQTYFGTGSVELEADSVHFSAIRIGS